MSKTDKSFTFKVSINPALPALHEALKGCGPYYRSKRLVQLALIGLSVEQGGRIEMAQASPPVKHTSSEKISGNGSRDVNHNIETETPQESAHYKLPVAGSAAMDAMEELFSTMQ